QTVSVCLIQVSVLIEESNFSGALSRFDDQLNRTGIEPLPTSVNPCCKSPPGETTIMFLTEFHLNFESSALCGGNYLFGLEINFRESLSAFDSSCTDVGTEVQVGCKFSLHDCNFKWSSACNGRDSIPAGKGDFSSRGTFFCNHPAGHRDLEYRHQ